MEYEYFEFHPVGFLFDVFAYIILHSVTVAVALSLYKDRDVRKLFSNLKPSRRKTRARADKHYMFTHLFRNKVGDASWQKKQLLLLLLG